MGLNRISAAIAACFFVAACGDDDAMMADSGPPPALCETDSDCDDGVFCNGEESCDPDAASAADDGCVSASSPCEAPLVCSESQQDCLSECPDGDADGHVESSCGGDDCDDADPDRYPGNIEVCDDGHDEDCDDSTLGPDDDGDGFAPEECCNGTSCGNDCNDDSAEVNVEASEICNQIDEDCDDSVDEGVLITYYEDSDGDGFGASEGASTVACSVPAGYSEVDTDCDDRLAAVNPGLAEVCDGLDNDCNGRLDGPNEDRDADGFAGCAGLPSHLLDCNDDDPAIYPGAPELCNEVDDDCSGDNPELEDADDDGYAARDAACTGGHLEKSDCDDAAASVNVDASEICNGVDDDCDDNVDGPAASAACSLPGAMATCEAGECTVSGCSGTLLDCDMLDSTGCEVDGDANDLYCGSCNMACDLAEYCSAGSCESYLEWATSFGGTSFDEGRDIAIDGAGNTYIVGSFRSESMVVGSTTLTNTPSDCGTSCNDDIFVIKLGPDDSVVWAVSFGSTAQDEGRAIDLVGSHLYIAGDYQAPITFGTTNLTHDTVHDAFVAKLSTTDGSVTWAVGFSGDVQEWGRSVAAMPNGDAVVAGFYGSSSLDVGSVTLPNTPRMTGGYSLNGMVARLSASDGSTVWARHFGADSSEELSGVAADASSVYIQGAFSGDTLDVGTTTLTNSSTGSSGWLAKLDASNGDPQWAMAFGGTSGSFSTEEVQLDSDQVYICGATTSNQFTIGSEMFTGMPNSTGYVASIATSDGSVTWAVSADGVGSQGVQGIAVGGGSVWAVLPAENDTAIGGLVFSPANQDHLLVRLDASNGSAIWGRTFGGNGFRERPLAVDVDSAGQVYFTGHFDSTAFIVADDALPLVGGYDACVISILLD